MMEGGSRAVRWKDEVKMENLDQFVMETAPQVSLLEKSQLLLVMVILVNF